MAAAQAGLWRKRTWLILLGWAFLTVWWALLIRFSSIRLEARALDTTQQPSVTEDSLEALELARSRLMPVSKVLRELHESTSSRCFAIYSLTCPSTAMSLLHDRLVFGGEPLYVEPEPGLFKPDTANTMSFKVCDGGDPSGEGEAAYLVYTGCGMAVAPFKNGAGFAEAASFTFWQDHFLRDSFSLEPVNFFGHLVVQKANMIAVEGEGDRPSATQQRIDASWRFAEKGMLGYIPSEAEMLDRAFFESVVRQTVILPRFDAGGQSLKTITGPSCDNRFKGCCFPPKLAGFEQPGANVRVPANRAGASSRKALATAVVVSSRKTFVARLALLNQWLFSGLGADSGVFAGAVITLDCALPGTELFALQKMLQSNPRASYSWRQAVYRMMFLIGPNGPPPSDFSEITYRVPVVMHWVFRNMQPPAGGQSDSAAPDLEFMRRSDWFFVVDDDSFVFPSHLEWTLLHFEHPRSKVYYVGHTSEWHEKTKYHGDMAFGGGGVLVSAAAANVWRRKWHMPEGGVMREWLATGRCSHSGGDGSFCRCLTWAVEDADRASFDEGIFADWKGFHQLDIVGTSNILDVVKKTCPDCPSPYEQLGLWVQDVVSRQPVVTLHHILSHPDGAVFPGLPGSSTGVLFNHAYATHPPLLILRRRCGESTSRHVVCINFGYTLEIYALGSSVGDVDFLLDRRGAAAGGQAQERLLSLAVRPGPQAALLCKMYYTEAPLAGGRPGWRYEGNDKVPRPAHAKPCPGATAAVSLSGTKMHVKGSYGSVQVSWEEDISSIHGSPVG